MKYSDSQKEKIIKLLDEASNNLVKMHTQYHGNLTKCNVTISNNTVLSTIYGSKSNGVYHFIEIEFNFDIEEYIFKAEYTMDEEVYTDYSSYGDILTLLKVYEFFETDEFSNLQKYVTSIHDKISNYDVEINLKLKVSTNLNVDTIDTQLNDFIENNRGDLIKYLTKMLKGTKTKNSNIRIDSANCAYTIQK